jgi:4'-phosphopantetheinyl transferase
MGVPGQISAGTVHVWFLDGPARADPTWLEILDPEERARAVRFPGQEQRDAFTAAHALVRTALSAYGRRSPEEWRFAISPQGRPTVLDSGELSFSLTHAGSRAAVAIAAGPALGLDLEPVPSERDALPIARRFFTETEWDWLSGLPPGDRCAGFAALWTVKEAVLKARGYGLTESLRSVEVDLDPSGRRVGVRAPGGPWALRSWSPQPGWFAALAVPTDTRLEVATFRARPLEAPVPAPELAPE